MFWNVLGDEHGYGKILLSPHRRLPMSSSHFQALQLLAVCHNEAGKLHLHCGGVEHRTLQVSHVAKSPTDGFISSGVSAGQLK